MCTSNNVVIVLISIYGISIRSLYNIVMCNCNVMTLYGHVLIMSHIIPLCDTIKLQYVYILITILTTIYAYILIKNTMYTHYICTVILVYTVSNVIVYQ